MCIDISPNSTKRPTAETAVTYRRVLLPVQVGHAEADEGDQMLDIGRVRLVAECHLVAKRTQKRGDDYVFLVHQDRQVSQAFASGKPDIGIDPQG